ncbi:AraC family transcriptional regulator, partial [Lacrimispora sp.]
VGYTNSKNFSRAFHNYYHMTPMQYRKKGNNQD